ncbi:hypothetical protein PAXRUDRAFT_827115, partial [Paxillus rubicundulus Ve08.2h10]
MTEPTAISLCCPGFRHHLAHGNQSSSTPSPNYCSLHLFLNLPTLASHHSSYGPTAQSPLHISTLTHPTRSFYALSTSYNYSHCHAPALEPYHNSQTSLNKSYFGPP